MFRLSVDEYKEKYLRDVEARIMAKKESIPHFTMNALNTAMLSEMNRADEETWEVEVPEDREQALREAESRMIEHIKKHVDLGVGAEY
jgi:hypothetical protein